MFLFPKEEALCQLLSQDEQFEEVQMYKSGVVFGSYFAAVRTPRYFPT